MLLLNQKFSLLKKQFIRITILLFVLIGNLWIWRIFASRPVIFFSVIVTTFLLYTYQENHKYKYLLIAFFSLTLYFQVSTNGPFSLNILSNDQIRIRDMRLQEYPHTYIKIGEKAVWFPVDEWFENDEGFRIFTRISNNLSEFISPNLYFFSNHPRERVGVKEFEKFPYIFIPFLVYGIIYNANRKEKIYLYSFLVPMLLISIIGNDNKLGPFSLLPFLAVSISNGIVQIYNHFEKKFAKHKYVIYWIFISLTLLILIQMYSYNVH